MRVPALAHLPVSPNLPRQLLDSVTKLPESDGAEHPSDSYFLYQCHRHELTHLTQFIVGLDP